MLVREEIADRTFLGEILAEQFHRRLQVGVRESSDRMEIVQGAEGKVDGDWKSLGRAPWYSIRPGARFGQGSSIGWSATASLR